MDLFLQIKLKLLYFFLKEYKIITSFFNLLVTSQQYNILFFVFEYTILKANFSYQFIQMLMFIFLTFS